MPRMKLPGWDVKRRQSLSHEVSAVNRRSKEEGAMKQLLAAVMSVAVMIGFVPVGNAAECPPEVAQAKAALAKKTSSARGQDIQAPRSLAGARGQDVQAPRGQ